MSQGVSGPSRPNVIPTVTRRHKVPLGQILTLFLSVTRRRNVPLGVKSQQLRCLKGCAANDDTVVGERTKNKTLGKEPKKSVYLQPGRVLHADRKESSQE